MATTVLSGATGGYQKASSISSPIAQARHAHEMDVTVNMILNGEKKKKLRTSITAFFLGAIRP